MYDETSGLVFKTWTAKGAPGTLAHGGLDWSRRPMYLVFKARSGRGVKGPRSLVEMATAIAANNIGEITEKHLDGVPHKLRWRIWRFLEARGTCFHAWRLLSKKLVAADDERELALYRYTRHICQPTESMAHYLQPITSLDVDFITCLSISGFCEFGTSDLLTLTDMRNLGVLEIIQPAKDTTDIFPRVHDRLIRGWTLKKNPFPLLRVLRIWCDQGISEISLQYVSAFPSLTLYDVVASRTDWHNAEKMGVCHGWIAERLMSNSGTELIKYLYFLDQLAESAPGLSGWDGAIINPTTARPRLDTEAIVKFAPPTDTNSTRTAYPPAALGQKTGRSLAGFQFPNPEPHVGHGVGFENWAFWLYAVIGQIRRDEDLKRQGLEVGHQAAVGPFVLPSRPLAVLHLGHSDARNVAESRPAYRGRGMFATSHWTFMRGVLPKSDEAVAAAAAPVQTPKAEPVLKGKKRQRMEDLLGSFS